MTDILDELINGRIGGDPPRKTFGKSPLADLRALHGVKFGRRIFGRTDEDKLAFFAAGYSMEHKRQLKLSGNHTCANCESIVRWSESMNGWYHLDSLRQACAGKVEPIASPKLKPDAKLTFKSY